MRTTALKVGELAKRTGLSVRTLHHYDDIGLLSPSHRTDAGYRLYVADEIVRLQQITSLRQLGFSLEQIRECLDGSDFSPQRVIALHMARLREQIEARRELCGRLEAIATGLRSTGEVPVEEFIRTIKEISRMETYYTPEQLEELKRRRETLGEERIRQVEAEWPELIARVQAEMDRGTDPASESAQALARRWMALVGEFTGGNPGIAQSLGTMWRQEESIHGMETAPMRGMMTYIGAAMAASKVAE